MNERVKELMVKAGIEIKSRRPYIDEVPDGYLESDNDFFINNHDTIIMLLEEGGLEKFAEFIVQECIDCLKPLSRNHSMVGAAQDTIREHFGVQE